MSKCEPLGVWAYGMIPEKGSLFLSDWSKIKEKHHVNKITWLFGNNIYDVTNTATQERNKKGARFPLQLMSLWVNGGSGGGRAWVREGEWKPSNPKVPRVGIGHAGWTQVCRWRNKRGGKRQKAARNGNTVHCLRPSRQEKVEDYGKRVG